MSLNLGLVYIFKTKEQIAESNPHTELVCMLVSETPPDIGLAPHRELSVAR